MLMLLTSALAVTASVARTRAELSTYIRLQVGGNLVEVAPDLAVLGAVAGIHYADDVPIAAAEVQLLADAGVGKPLGDRLAHHNFALAGLEPAAARDLDVVAHLDAGGLQAAHGDVHAVGIVHVGEIDDGDDFERCQRLAIGAGSDAGLELQILELGTLEVADDFRFGAFAQHQDLQRVARNRKAWCAGRSSATGWPAARPL